MSHFGADALYGDKPLAGYWMKPEEGFEWVTSADPRLPTPTKQRQFLLPKGKYSAPYAMLRRRRAIANDFLNLARDVTEESVCEFASKWGSLGVGLELIRHEGRFRRAESIESWEKQAAEFAGLKAMWDKVKTQDHEFLKDIVYWNHHHQLVDISFVIGGDGSLSPPTTGNYEGPSWPQSSRFHHVIPSHASLMDRWKGDDVIEPARYVICSYINDRLKGQIDRVVLPYGNYEVRYCPRSLMAAMYCHLQDEVSSEKGREKECKWERCAQKWFFPSREDQVFCSNSCRTNHWRSQKRQSVL